MPSARIDQRLNRGKWGYLTGLVYPHGLACRNSPASPLRQRSQVTSDPARLVTPHYRIETLRASNETWEDVGEMTVLKG